MNKHIVVAIFVIEDQETTSIDDIKRQFSHSGYMSTYNEQGESFTYEPESISVTTIDNDMFTDTKVYGYD